jgi:glycosyltransferase involved in cell wall biosynthesis
MLGRHDIAPARTSSGLPANAFVIGYVGTIFHGDAELMAAAFDLVKAEIPTALLLVAGYCPVDMGRLTRHPEAVVQTGQVTQDRLVSCLGSCDIFWLPLRDTNANRGRWPHKLNDYMALGRPTVATAVGDLTALFKEDEIGLLSPDQPRPFAARTIELARDRGMRQRMGERAREVARDRFSWARLTDELEDLYRDTIARYANRKVHDGPSHDPEEDA